MIKMFAFLMTLTINVYAVEQITKPPELASGKTVARLVQGKNSMVVTNNPWASKAAEQILASGGNAFDAAIASAFILGLTEPQSSGIGGGGFAITYDKNKKNPLVTYDGREVAPQTANPNWFLTESGTPLSFNEASLSPKAIGVPGEVALLYKLHQAHGTLAWNKLLTPAIKLAEQGFPMSPRLHKLLTSDQDILSKDPNIRQVFFKNNHIKTIGDKVINKEYAQSLKTIAKDPNLFYHGDIAHAIVEKINKSAGQELYTINDLKNYSVLTKPALCDKFRDKYTICSMQPVSSGGITVLQLMKIYANNYTKNDYNDDLWLHNFLEASKLAFADRNQYSADPAFIKQPVAGLLNEDYIKSRSKLVSQTKSLKTPVAAGKPNGIDKTYAPDIAKKPKGTTSVAITDKDGNAISLTLTVEQQFGSHIFVKGFFLNNQLTDFSLTPTNENGQLIANRVEAGKRPRSSMAPVLVFDKKNDLLVVAGSPGGSQIICYVAKNLIQMLDMQMDPKEAISSGNLCSTNNIAQVEINSDLALRAKNLAKFSQNYKLTELTSGETNILRKNDFWLGAADPRREGIAIGK